MARAISLSTSSVQPLKAEAAFQAAKAAGYAGVELMIAPNRDIKDENHIKDLIQKHQISVTSIHAPTLLLCKFVWGTEPGQKLRKSVEFAEKVGASSVVVHPPFKNNPYATRFLPLVNELNKNSHVDIAVENMFPWVFQGKAKEMYGPSWDETCETVEHLTFDFSHAALSGMEILSFFEQYHQKVRVIHLTDGTQRGAAKGDAVKDEHLIPGEGSMPIREVYDILNRNNWEGDTVLEINTRKWKTFEAKLSPLRKSSAYFNQVANPSNINEAMVVSP